MRTEERLFRAKQEAITAARRLEMQTGNYCYIARTSDNSWLVTKSMPFIGEWYDTSGIKHG